MICLLVPGTDFSKEMDNCSGLGDVWNEGESSFIVSSSSSSSSSRTKAT